MWLLWSLGLEKKDIATLYMPRPFLFLTFSPGRKPRNYNVFPKEKYIKCFPNSPYTTDYKKRIEIKNLWMDALRTIF